MTDITDRISARLLLPASMTANTLTRLLPPRRQKLAPPSPSLEKPTGSTHLPKVLDTR